MLGPTQTVLMYYLGGGFVIFLGWGVFVPDHQLNANTAQHYLRWTLLAAIIGLLHPAIALAARDIIGQVGIELPYDVQLAKRHASTATIIDTLTVASLAPVAGLIALNTLS